MSEARAGISIGHVQPVGQPPGVLRGDIVAFVGAVLPKHWPDGAALGDVLEGDATDVAAFRALPDRTRVDPVTRGSVVSCFKNGGRHVVLLGVCVRALEDLAVHEGVHDALIEVLEDREEIGLVACPAVAFVRDVHARDGLPLYNTLIRRLIAHARQMPLRMVLVDPPRAAEAAAVVAWAKALRVDRDIDASYGAIYWPWVTHGDHPLPPSGAVAGLYARVEAEHAPHGVHWPPANLPLRAVSAPEVEMTWAEGGALLQKGVNPVLAQAGRGVVVWGARTLSDDPSFCFVNARRVVSYAVELLRRDAEWVVFEHQRPELWGTVARMVRARLDELWSAGLLTGERMGSEYLVQCDAELNPPARRDAGEVHVRVRLRPVSTTEFVDVELSLGS